MAVAVVTVAVEGKGGERSDVTAGTVGGDVGEGGRGEGGVAVGSGIAVRGSTGSPGSLGSTESVVRRHRNLMVSFCGFAPSGSPRCVCDKTGPLDSSDELSVPSGVESESNKGRGERRLRARDTTSSSSPETLGLGRFRRDVCCGTTVTSGTPVCGPALLRTEE